MIVKDQKTVLVAIRISKPLIEQFDALVRERAFLTNRRITRNSAIVELVRAAISADAAQEDKLSS